METIIQSRTNTPFFLAVAVLLVCQRQGANVAQSSAEFPGGQSGRVRPQQGEADVGPPPALVSVGVAQRKAIQPQRPIIGRLVEQVLPIRVHPLGEEAIKEETGQLFYDIALAICAAVTLSLIVSISVIPTAGAKFLRNRRPARGPIAKAFRSLFGLTVLLAGGVTPSPASSI